MVWSYLKTLLSVFVLVICVSAGQAKAEHVKIIVSPVNVPTGQSSYGIYPNISDFMVADIVNELNKNSRFYAIGSNSAESMLMSQGMYEDYRDFLKKYKDSKVIDYKMCGNLTRSLGIDKMLLVSAGFSFQDMILKRPLLYKLGFTEVEPIKSFYRLNIDTAMVDTQTCLVDFERSYNKNIRTESFEVPTSSLNDNIVSSKKIKEFSAEVSSDVNLNVLTSTNQSGFARVKSNIVSTTNIKKDSRDGLKTRDGHSFSTNNNFLKNKRIESFKDWVKETVDTNL